MSDKPSNVVFLAFRNDEPTDTVNILACKACSNKTYTALYDNTSEFPCLQCAACHRDAGYFGWVDPSNVAGN
jgi:hypothetical protein